MPQSAPARSATDTALARNLMVDGQLRPTKVNDRRILDAMRTLPRELFLPPHLAELAYIDEDIKLGGGRAMLKPLVLARLLQLAVPREGEAALIVGCGTGYGAAVLAACGAHVTALEQDDALLAIAKGALAGTGGVSLVSGKLADGYAAAAPYDLIVIEGAVRAIPDEIARQVAANGRLVTVIAPDGAGSYAAIAEPSSAGLRARAAFDAAAPLLPGLAPAPSFSF